MAQLLSEKNKREIEEIIREGGSELSFSDRFVSDSSGRYIFSTLKRTLNDGTATCPSTVEAKGCQFGVESTMALSDLLKDPNCKIATLSLEWNSVGTFESALTDLSSSLSTNCFLSSLDLRNNGVGPVGCAALARALRNNRTLTSLDLRWNDVGNAGALAFKDLLATGMNVTLKEVKLGGNKVSDSILQEVEGLCKRRAEGSAGGGGGSPERQGATPGYDHAVTSTLQLQNEELMAEVGRLSTELQLLKEELRKKESVHVFEKSKVKSELEAKLESLEHQLQDSAAAVGGFEIELLRERERVSRLQDSLAAEQKEKDTILSTMRLEKESIAGRKVASDREKQQLATTVRITEEALEALRKEEDALRKQFADREKELLTQLSDRERKLAEAKRGEDKAKAEQSRLDVALADARLREEMAEERAQQCTKLLDECTEDRAKRLEEARVNAQEAAEKIKAEMAARVKAADARTQEAEKKLSESEIQRRAAESRAAAASVVMEQKLSDQAVKIRGEMGNLQDGEVRELTGSLDVMRAQRESQDMAISQLTADLESLRDLREKESESAKATFEKLNKNLSESLSEARKERGLASDLRLEVASLKRQLDPFKRRVETAEAEKKRSEEFRQRDIEQLQSLVAKEREDRARESVSYQKRLDECNELLRTAREGLSEQRTSHLKEFHKLEKGMVAAVQAIFTDRRTKSFGGSGAGEDGKAKKKGGKENEETENL